MFVALQSDVAQNDASSVLLFFFFNDTATTEIYTLSLHDALPICRRALRGTGRNDGWRRRGRRRRRLARRSEEHTSELQSLAYLVCRLLLEKKKPNCALPARPRAMRAKGLGLCGGRC